MVSDDHPVVYHPSVGICNGTQMDCRTPAEAAEVLLWLETVYPSIHGTLNTLP